MKLATWNVNSLKVRLPHLLEWLAAAPDVICLQETKTEDEKFCRPEIEQAGYRCCFTGQKTYNGVAILSKFPLADVTRGLPALTPEDEADDQARYIEAVASLPGSALRVASAYVPNGMDPASSKFTYKLRFFERLRAHWAAQMGLHEAAVLGGDFNCAPAPLDVYDAPKLEGTVCYHPEERARLRALMHLGFYDAFRVLHPARAQFSWWDYRGGAYERGHGLRIDHLLLSAIAADGLQACEVDESPRRAEKPSDHAPMVATLRV